jgi:tetratricopeptide (TPR) repeat protein
MMKLKMTFVSLLFVTAIFASFSAYAQSPSPQETFNQYISDLQKSPSDTALREKIIRLAREMNPSPAIPEEARRHYVKASALLEDAKQPSDSADAAEEFRLALLVAPWWGEAYMKMGMTLETAERYDDAIAALKLFMVTNPQDEVLRKAQDEIYKIEAKKEKAAKDKELAAKKAVEDQRMQQEEFLRKINGAQFVYLERDGSVGAMLNVKGDTVTWIVESDRWPGTWEPNGWTFKIDGKMLRSFQNGRPNPYQSGVITEDGNTITITQTPVNATIILVFKRAR